MNEFSLIEKYFAPLAASFPGALGLTDDAALVDVPAGHRLVLTKDAIVAGVHFFPDDPPDAIARKLIRVNLSDLAAMGARPYALMLAAAFPTSLDEIWLEAFAKGLADDCRVFDVPLIGGDTTATPGPLTLSLTALGIVPAGHEIRRTGAEAGDLVCVSGTIGDAALGLLVAQGGLGDMSSEVRASLLDRYRIPLPRLGLGQTLAEYAHAGMDLSDGLPGDLRHLCRNGGLGAEVDVDALPLSSAVRDVLDAHPHLWPAVASGGDDYELLLAIPSSKIKNAQEAACGLGMRLTVIGRFLETPDLSFRKRSGEDVSMLLSGYQHFKGTDV